MTNWRILRNRFRKILVATVILTAIGIPLLMTIGAQPARAATGLLLFGLGLGAFEEFYFQAKSGEWLRRLHPLVSLAISIAAALAIVAAATVIDLVLWGATDRIAGALINLARNLHIVLLLIAGLVLSLRVISFIGGRTLLRLMTGRYHRPVNERRVLAFLDIKGSTALVERLGPLRGKEAIERIVSRLSRLVIEHGGDVYIFTGDGLIGIWDWDAAIDEARILDFAHAALAAVSELEPGFSRDYGVVPAVRIGIHGGEVVVSEQGDLRRAIGIWGDVINIAARLEQAGKELGRDCIISREIVKELGGGDLGLEPLAPIHAKGISHEIAAYALTAGASPKS